MAVKTHPDKGGNENDFQKVSIAYTILLKKLNDMNNNHDHNDMKNSSKEMYDDIKGVKNVNLSDNFDSSLFNKIYDENRIGDIYDDGYGKWMDKTSVDNVDTKKMFNGNFNKDMFNSEFNKYKKSQNVGKELVKYDNPEVKISYKGGDQLMGLGSDKINDFSGEGSMGLHFRDYKDAYTNTCLIDTDDVKIGNRSRNMNDIEVQRSNVQYQMNDNDNISYELQKKREEENEMKRVQRIQMNDNNAFNQYDRIHKRMLNN